MRLRALIADERRIARRMLSRRRLGFLALAVALECVGRQAAARGSDLLGYLRTPEEMILFILPLVYGVQRLLRFHPAGKSRYTEWLRMTPWTAADPLPLGPVSLRFADLLYGAALTWACWFCLPETSPWLIPALFLGGYLGILWLARIRDPWLFLGLSIIVGLAPNLRAIVAAEIPIYLLALHLIRLDVRELARRLLAAPEVPFRFGGDLIPLPPVISQRGRPYPWPKAAALGAIVAVWSYIACRWLVNASAGYSSGFFVLVLYGVAIISWVSFSCSSHFRAGLPAIPWRARIGLRRLIWPDYDRIFVMPVAILILGAALPIGFLVAGIPVPFAAAASLGIIAVLAMAVGPDLRRWELTGPISVGPSFLVRSSKIAEENEEIRDEKLAFAGGAPSPVNPGRATSTAKALARVYLPSGHARRRPLHRWRDWLAYLFLKNSKVWILMVLVPPCGLGLMVWIALQDEEGWRALFGLPVGALLLVCVLAAAFRNQALALVQDPGALKWVRRSPWKATDPPPFGIVGLSWRDLVLMAFVTAVAALLWRPLGVGFLGGRLLLVPGMVYLVCYTLGGMLLLPSIAERDFFGGRRWVLAALCAAAASIPSWTFSVCWLAVAVALLEWCERRAMREAAIRLPTHATPATEHSRLKLSDCWTFHDLAPLAPGPGPSGWARLRSALLLGWCVGCGLLFIERVGQLLDPGMSARGVALFGHFLLSYFLPFAVFVRYFRRRRGRRPPLSLLGRLRTGRLWLRGYDWLLLLHIALGVFVFMLNGFLANLVSIGWLSLPLTLTLVSLAFSFAPPTSAGWSLTSRSSSPRALAGPTGG